MLSVNSFDKRTQVLITFYDNILQDAVHNGSSSYIDHLSINSQSQSVAYPNKPFIPIPTESIKLSTTEQSIQPTSKIENSEKRVLAVLTQNSQNEYICINTDPHVESLFDRSQLDSNLEETKNINSTVSEDYDQNCSNSLGSLYRKIKNRKSIDLNSKKYQNTTDGSIIEDEV